MCGSFNPTNQQVWPANKPNPQSYEEVLQHPAVLKGGASIVGFHSSLCFPPSSSTKSSRDPLAPDDASVHVHIHTESKYSGSRTRACTLSPYFSFSFLFLTNGGVLGKKPNVICFNWPHGYAHLFINSAPPVLSTIDNVVLAQYTRYHSGCCSDSERVWGLGKTLSLPTECDGHLKPLSTQV